jgi:hypothetical protein
MKTIEELAQEIDYYTAIYSVLEMTCKELHIHFAASPLYNFRDALSHYIILYENCDDETRIAQETSITEHLFRGLKDGYFFIILKLKQGIYYEMQKAEITAKEFAQNLRKILHQYKALELKVRDNSELFSVDFFTPYFEKLTTLIAETKSLFVKNQLKFDFGHYEKVSLLETSNKIPNYEVANIE